MPEVMAAVARFRAEAGEWLQGAVPLEKALTRCYPVSCILVPELSVQAICDYLRRHDTAPPSGLVTCQDRSLRGGIVARYGYGLLFADSRDSEAEIRFTLAHEAKHFLMDHYYPRCDLLERFGPGIRPVLDGRRQPTREERIDALLARAELAQHTHLLDRDACDAHLHAIESDADAFACELLAPHAALCARFPALRADAAAIPSVHTCLVEEFGLPSAPALAYARAWVAENGEPVTLLHRLRLI